MHTCLTDLQHLSQVTSKPLNNVMTARGAGMTILGSKVYSMDTTGQCVGLRSMPSVYSITTLLPF
jgi:hypothetical protein